MSPFEQAAQDVRQLTRKPPTMTLLRLYALFRQGRDGDVQGERPGMAQFADRAKHDAWAALAGTPPEQAQRDYVELVAQLQREDADSDSSDDDR